MNLKKNNKAYLQISFGWLFAILVGAFVLFLAIFAVVKIIDTEQNYQSGKTAQKIGILTNPLETGFESSKSTYIITPVKTRIYTRCKEDNFFGKQLLSVSEEGIKTWSSPHLESEFKNKYIFSANPTEGKKFYLFSKPFLFPFKIGDLIYLTSHDEKYCFYDAPEKIEKEIKNKQENLLIEENCTGDEINVCFKDRDDCNIMVEYDSGKGKVSKNNEEIFFIDDSLMYAAIFADKDEYSCQVKRLMQRVAKLCMLYEEKASIIAAEGCGDGMKDDLTLLNEAAENIENSDIGFVLELAEDLERQNDDNVRCRLW